MKGQATAYEEQAGASPHTAFELLERIIRVNFSQGRVLERGDLCLQCLSSKKISLSGNNFLKFSITATDSMLLRKLQTELKLWTKQSACLPTWRSWTSRCQTSVA